MVYTKNGNADQILESYAYTYDKNSNIVSETRRSNLAGATAYENKAYTYDVYGRLTKSVTTDYNNSNAKSTVTYGYDAVGNRTTMTAGGKTTSYSYNGLNQLTSKTDGMTTTTYTYDGRGNQIQEKTGNTVTNFTYAVSGEMLTVSSGSAVIQQNEYNHEGIRIRRTEGNTTRQYLYDNGSVAYTLDNGSLSGANVLGGYQNVIGTYRGSNYYVYNKDIQGSTESITDGSFNAKAAYEYADFGEVTELTENIDNEICYTGSIHDETTGLHYMNARYYDPANGRFISQDSYRGELTDSGQWHLYVYCANNPINYTDPSGHSLWSFLEDNRPISFKYRWIKRGAIATAIDIAFGIIGGVSITALEKYAKKYFKKYMEKNKKKKLKSGLEKKITKVAKNLQKKGKKLYDKLYEDAKKMKKGKKRDFVLGFLGKSKVKDAIKATVLNNISGFLDGYVVEVTTGYKYYDCLTSASGFIASAVDYAVDKELYSGKIYLCALD